MHSELNRINNKITIAYLYTISKYGYPPKIEDTTAHIREMASLGFSSIELEGIGHSNIEYLYENREEIVTLIKELELEVPIFCVVLPEMSSFKKKVREEQLHFFEKGCEIAKALGAEGVLDNGPLPPYNYPTDMPIKRHYTGDQLYGLPLPINLEWKSYWEELTSTFKDACDIAKKYGLQYHLHPCEGSLVSNTDSYENFSLAVNRDNLVFNLDTANQFFLKDNIALSALRLGEKITYIHISDNTGKELGHLVPEAGDIHWDSFFQSLKKIGFSGRFGIDVGGAESRVTDLNSAYNKTAIWLERQIEKHQLFS
tara:strand:+ start:4091 stop:5029 length:939 start_codon:yes stop_codon:yes gene_type:complete